MQDQNVNKYRICITQDNCSNIDSQNGIFTYQLQKQKIFGNFSLKDAVFFNTFNNINQNYYQFKIRIVATLYTISIPFGQYDLSGFLQRVQALILSQTGFTLTYNVTSIPYYITTYQVLSGATPQNFIFEKFNDHRDQIYRYFGFSSNNSSFSTLQTTQVGDIQNNVSVTSAIHLNILQPYLNSDNRFTFNIHLNAGYSEALIYQSDASDYYKITNSGTQILDQIQFQLLDDNEKMLSYNQNFSLTFICF